MVWSRTLGSCLLLPQVHHTAHPTRSSVPKMISASILTSPGPPSLHLLHLLPTNSQLSHAYPSP